MEWNERYNIGIDVIDNQHRQILDYINALVMWIRKFEQHL